MKHLLLKSWLVLVCLLMGAGTSWADNITFTFVETGTNNDDSSSKSAIADIFATNGNLVQSITTADKCMHGAAGYGLKMGNSSTNGKLSFTLKTGVVLDKIVATASPYSATEKTLKINGTSFTLGTSKGTFEDVTLTCDGETTITTITLEGSKRVYVNKLVLHVHGGGDDPTPVKYAITIADDIQNGEVSADPTEAAAGTEVSLTATPSTGYKLSAWDVKDASLNAITVTDNKFTMPASAVIVNATFDEVGAAVLPLSFSGYQEKSDWTFNADWSSSDLTSASAYYKLFSGNSISTPKMTFGDNAFVRFTVNMRTTGGASGNSDKLDIYFGTTLLGTIKATSNSLADYTLDLTGTSIPSGEGVLTFKSETTDGAKGLGVRSISIEAVTQPLLECASSVTLDYNTTNGEIPYSITNPDGSTLTAKVNAEATWISNITVDAENNKVTFIAEENNTGIKRNAIITLTYGAINREVAIIQNRLVLDYAILPFNVAAGTSSADLKEMDGVSLSVDGTDYKNDTHKVKLSKNTHYVQVKTNERIGVCSFSFCGLADQGSSSFKLQESVNGTEWTDVESFTVTFAKKNDVVIWTSTKSFSNNARYVKLAFLKNKDEVNCGLGEFSIAKYVPTNLEIEIKPFATDGELYYATFSSEYAWVVPEDLIVSEARLVEDKLAFEPYKTSDVVPANTGVLVSALAASTYVVNVETDEETLELAESVLGKDNMLHPASEDKEGLKENHKFYMLARDANGENIGFYYGAADGGVFTSREGSAYLAVPKSASAPARFIFGQRGVPTDLLNVNDNNQSTKVLRNGCLYILRDGKTYDSLGRMVK